MSTTKTIDELIANSSFGSRRAVRLRRLTPPAVVAQIVAASEDTRGIDRGSDIGASTEQETRKQPGQRQ